MVLVAIAAKFQPAISPDHHRTDHRELTLSLFNHEPTVGSKFFKFLAKTLDIIQTQENATN
ncbi:hypothetical protein AY600_12445 [Phormidium willei BDU 130791]|nr:hypothetical protein AY600_12445 [Phormidium willei BDU 130791]